MLHVILLRDIVSTLFSKHLNIYLKTSGVNLAKWIHYSLLFLHIKLGPPSGYCLT